MKYIFTFILALTLINPVFSQNTTDFGSMTPAEIRHFLLTQTDSEEAQIMIKKHNTSRITAYSMLAGSVLLMIVSNNSSKDSTTESKTIVTGLFAGVLFAGAGIAGITASERMKKAKGIYNSQTSPSLSFHRQVRNEAEVINSIFRYPRPH